MCGGSFLKPVSVQSFLQPALHGIYVNGEKAEGCIFGRGKDGTEFPLLLIAIVIYIVIGVFFNLWTPVYHQP